MFPCLGSLKASRLASRSLITSLRPEWPSNGSIKRVFRVWSGVCAGGRVFGGLPHDLLVFEGDDLQARDILEIPRQEISEREHEQDVSPSSSVMPQWIVTLTIFVLVAFIALTVVIVNRAIR